VLEQEEEEEAHAVALSGLALSRRCIARRAYRDEYSTKSQSSQTLPASARSALCSSRRRRRKRALLRCRGSLFLDVA